MHGNDALLAFSAIVFGISAWKSHGDEDEEARARPLSDGPKNRLIRRLSGCPESNPVREPIA